MKRIGGFLFVLFLVISCTSQNGIMNEQSKVKVTDVTVQEMVSGIEGGKNVYEFLMTIETGSDKVQPDSLIHRLYKAKIYLKDSARNIYKAQYTESAERVDLKNVSKSVFVSFKGKENTFTIEVDSVRVLDKMYMP
jgi:hypothetical protein